MSTQNLIQVAMGLLTIASAAAMLLWPEPRSLYFIFQFSLLGLLFSGAYWAWKLLSPPTHQNTPEVQGSLSATTSIKEILEENAAQKAEQQRTKVEGYEQRVESGRELFQRSVSRDSDCKKWQQDFEEWLTSAEDFIRAQEGHRIAGLFKRNPSFYVVPRDARGFNPDHQSKLTLLSYKLEDLVGHLENAKDGR